MRFGRMSKIQTIVPYYLNAELEKHLISNLRLIITLLHSKGPVVNVLQANFVKQKSIEKLNVICKDAGLHSLC